MRDVTVPEKQEPTESGNTDPWLADNQSRDLNNEFWLVVYKIRSVPAEKGIALIIYLGVRGKTCEHEAMLGSLIPKYRQLIQKNICYYLTHFTP